MRGDDLKARLATGEWVAFIDDDCVADAGWLRALLALASRADLDVIEGRTEMPVEVEHPFTHGVENRAGGVFWSCNLAVRRERFLALGGFDEDEVFVWILTPERPDVRALQLSWLMISRYGDVNPSQVQLPGRLSFPTV